MSETLSRRLEWLAPRATVTLAWLLALGLTAWFAAQWYWQIKAPGVTAHPQTLVSEPIAAARELAARHLFGFAPPPVAGATQAVSNSRFTLIGVAAHSGNTPGFAVIQEEGKTAAGFVQGEEVAPGVKLARILPGAVELERNGSRETVRLPDNLPNKAGAPGAPGATNFSAMQPMPTNPGAPNWAQNGAPGANFVPPGVNPIGNAQNGPGGNNVPAIPMPQNPANPANFENRPPQ